jgi:hypothetical protein
MFRVDHPTGVAVLEPPTPVRLQPGGGYFARGDARIGTEGTIIDAEWLNMLQEELCNVVILNRDPADPDALDKADRTQLLQTIIDISPGGGGGGGTGGAGITEPLDDGYAHSRENPVGAAPAPPETGNWNARALKEPPAPSTGEIAQAYSRTWTPGEPEAKWVVATGRQRVDPSLGPAEFHVEKDGSNDDGDGSEEAPWLSIQFAIDYISQNIDADGRGVDILVGPSGSVAWDGFEVSRRVVNCPLYGLRVLAKPGVAPVDCEIGPCVYGSAEALRTCVYANGGRVCVGGFRFMQPTGTTPATRGVAIKSDGSGSVCRIVRPVEFQIRAQSQDHLWANAEGVIKVDANYTILTGAITPAPAQFHHMHVSNAGMIIYAENFVVTFQGANNFQWFILGESGGIALLRQSWRSLPTTILNSGPAIKYYVCGKAVIDCGPMYATHSTNVGPPVASPAPTPMQASGIIPGTTATSILSGGKRIFPIGGN